MIEFNEELHEYRRNGMVIPSVTQIIDVLYKGSLADIPRAILERKTMIGKAVHLATELHDAGELDEDSLHPIVAGYLAGWRKFLAEHDTRWTGIERRVFNEKYLYAGTLDRKGYVDGQHAYIDIKTVAKVAKATGAQLAAYQEAERAIDAKDGITHSRRIAVQLHENGTYTEHPFESKSDFNVFLACLSIRNFTN